MACRYANSSQQAIAARAEQQGLLIEGFNAHRLIQEQAKLPNAGKGLHNEQVNILNLPMPDFDVSGAFPWTSLFAHAAFIGSKGCLCPLFRGHLRMPCYACGFKMTDYNSPCCRSQTAVQRHPESSRK